MTRYYLRLHGSVKTSSAARVSTTVRPSRRAVGGLFLPGMIPALLSMFEPSLALAEQHYEPPVSTERLVDTFIVKADGSYRQIMEETLRIETPRGIRSQGTQYVGYPSSRETIESIEAWIFQPDGTKVIVPTASILDQDDNTEFSDYKYKVIIYPQVQVGSRLFLRTESTVKPLFEGQFFRDYGLRRSLRVNHWEVNITVPSGKPLYIEQRGVLGGLEKSSPDGDHYRFTYQNTTTSAPDEVAVADFDYTDELRVSSLPDALAVGSLYHANAAPKAAVTDTIRARAELLTSGISAEQEKAKALYDWVARNIRYVSISLDNGGYVPHAADQVLTNGYGDCKDHVVLLEALLAAVGIDSVAALVNSGSTYTLSQVGVFIPFNHVITYLPTLNLYVDSTARFVPFGALPFEDTDKPVVLTSLGRLGRTPNTGADTNFSHTRVAMVIHSDGSVEGTSRTTMSGYYEISSRAARFSVRGDPQDQVVKGILSQFGETGSGSLRHVDPEDIDTPYWTEGRFELDPVANMPGRGAMRIPVGLGAGRFADLEGYKPAVSLQQPPWPCGSLSLSESYSIRFPSNVVITGIPQNRSYHDDQIDFHSMYRSVGRRVFVQRTLLVRRPSQVCNREDLLHWRAFLITAQRDLRSQIFYQ